MIEQYTVRSGTSAGPTPSRAATPGRNDSSTTSARSSSARANAPSSGQAADDRLLAGVERVEPAGRGRAHRVAARLLDPHDARAEPEQLGGRERARQVAGEVDDEHARERPLHPARTVPLPFDGLGERSTVAEEKRRIILDAAVRVFAHKGFHTSRVGDIAEEAGVAHGLLYHYFSSKDEVLETIFRENWGILVERIHAVEESGEPAREQLRHVAAILLRTWRHEPDVVRVLVREIVRSPEVAASGSTSSRSRSTRSSASSSAASRRASSAPTSTRGWPASSSTAASTSC